MLSAALPATFAMCVQSALSSAMVLCCAICASFKREVSRRTRRDSPRNSGLRIKGDPTAVSSSGRKHDERLAASDASTYSFLSLSTSTSWNLRVNASQSIVPTPLILAAWGPSKGSRSAQLTKDFFPSKQQIAQPAVSTDGWITSLTRLQLRPRLDLKA